MKIAGLFAAGEGSRFHKAFPGIPKPLLPVAGSPLCVWVAGALHRAGITEITMLLNSRGTAAREILKLALPQVRWNFLVKDTPASWDSFRLVCAELSSHRSFLVTTTDALIPSGETARFAARMADLAAGLGLGLTRSLDDDKPLWADLSAAGRITALGPDSRRRELATAGLYYMTGARARTLPQAGGYASLREYLTAAAKAGDVFGLELGPTLDVDRPEDLPAAEDFARAARIPRAKPAAAGVRP